MAELPETKLSQLRAAYTDGRMKTALRIAAKFPNLGVHAERIQRGWAALTRPGFYVELGCDPDALVADGLAAIKERYGF